MFDTPAWGGTLLLRVGHYYLVWDLSMQCGTLLLKRGTLLLGVGHSYSVWDAPTQCGTLLPDVWHSYLVWDTPNE